MRQLKTPEEIVWWEDMNNKEFINFPVSVIKVDDNWTITVNEDTATLLGDSLYGIGSAKTKEEAIQQMFMMIRITHEYSEQCRLSYQRWVPLRKGPWNKTGGNWISIFGIHIYFRLGRSMKGGWYIPFTKLNVSISSDWRTYKTWKSKSRSL